MVSTPTGGTDPTIRRRFRITMHLDEQLALLDDPLHMRVERKRREGQVIEVKKKVRPAWIVRSDGSVVFTLKRGKTNLLGDKSVVAPSVKELSGVLTTLKQAVEAGELDEALEQATIASRIGPKSKATWCVASQTTRRDKLAYRVARRQRMPSRQRDDPFPIGKHERAADNEQRTGATRGEGRECGLDVIVRANIDNGEPLADRLRSRFQVVSFRHSVGTRGHKNGNGRRGGHQLAQQFQSLRAQPSGEKTHACDVPARPVEACDKAVPDRVAPGGEDDRHRRGHGLGRESRKNISDDHGDRSASEIGRQSRQLITVVVR
jgi:hypothetical protein